MGVSGASISGTQTCGRCNLSDVCSPKAINPQSADSSESNSRDPPLGKRLRKSIVSIHVMEPAVQQLKLVVVDSYRMDSVKDEFLMSDYIRLTEAEAKL